MNTQLAINSAKHLGKIFQKNSPTILTGLAVGGFLTTIFMAIRATPKALWLLEELEHEVLKKDEYPPSKLDLAKVLWRPYLPTALMGMSTIACMIGANSIHLRRNAALASLYSLADTTLREYQTKVVETIGRNKEEGIRSDLNQGKLDKNPIGNNTVIITGKGSYLCYDSLSGRYFRSDVETIRKLQNQFNHQLLSDMFISLNDWYYELGLTPIDLGGQMGWSVDYALMDIQFTSNIATDGEPCIVLQYRVQPKDHQPGFS